LIDKTRVLKADLRSTNGGQITNHSRSFFFPQQPD
jgi:hypothetical protein